MIRVFICLFSYFFTAISVLISPYSLLIAMLNCSFNFKRFVVKARNVQIKDVFYRCFFSPVYTETTQDSCKYS